MAKAGRGQELMADWTEGLYLLRINITFCSSKLQSKCSCGKNNGGSCAAQVILKTAWGFRKGKQVHYTSILAYHSPKSHQ